MTHEITPAQSPIGEPIVVAEAMPAVLEASRPGYDIPLTVAVSAAASLAATAVLSMGIGHGNVPHFAVGPHTSRTQLDKVTTASPWQRQVVETDTTPHDKIVYDRVLPLAYAPLYAQDAHAGKPADPNAWRQQVSDIKRVLGNENLSQFNISVGATSSDEAGTDGSNAGLGVKNPENEALAQKAAAVAAADLKRDLGTSLSGSHQIKAEGHERVLHNNPEEMGRIRQLAGKYHYREYRQMTSRHHRHTAGEPAEIMRTLDELLDQNRSVEVTITAQEGERQFAVQCVRDVRTDTYIDVSTTKQQHIPYAIPLAFPILIRRRTSDGSGGVVSDGFVPEAEAPALANQTADQTTVARRHATSASQAIVSASPATKRTAAGGVEHVVYDGEVVESTTAGKSGAMSTSTTGGLALSSEVAPGEAIELADAPGLEVEPVPERAAPASVDENPTATPEGVIGEMDKTPVVSRRSVADSVETEAERMARVTGSRRHYRIGINIAGVGLIAAMVGAGALLYKGEHYEFGGACKPAGAWGWADCPENTPGTSGSHDSLGVDACPDATADYQDITTVTYENGHPVDESHRYTEVPHIPR